jgi:putative membrane protein
MHQIGLILALMIALLHLWILVMEMFRWEHPRTRKVFGTTPEVAALTKKMAANQGLYNGFLAAGILWGYLRPDDGIILFFLGCIAVAGIYGGITVKPRIAMVQTLPAVIVMALIWFGAPGAV